MHEYSFHPSVGAFLRRQFPFVQQSPDANSPFFLPVNLARPCLYLSSVFISGLVLFHGHSCQHSTVCCGRFCTIVSASECCAAFHTSPTASNEAELALPKGGFRVARYCLSETNWPGMRFIYLGNYHHRLMRTHTDTLS